MIGSVEEALRLVDASIKPTGSDIDRFRLRADAVGGALERQQVAESWRIVGSVARSTALRNYSDVDVLAVSNVGHDPTVGPTDEITKLALALSNSGIEAAVNEITVSVRFEQPPSVDVIPAIRLRHDDGYRIPRGSDNIWQEFHPARLESLTADSVHRIGPDFLGLVRLLKYWNVSRGVGLKSSDLEELASVALGDTEVMVAYSESIVSVIRLCVDWILNQNDALSRVGRRCATPVEKNTHIVLDDSLALAVMMSQMRHEHGSGRLTKEFFGDGHAEYLR